MQPAESISERDGTVCDVLGGCISDSRDLRALTARGGCHPSAAFGAMRGNVAKWYVS